MTSDNALRKMLILAKIFRGAVLSLTSLKSSVVRQISLWLETCNKDLLSTI